MSAEPGKRLRLFVALDLSPEVVAKLSEVQQKLRPLTEAARLEVRWSQPENLHLTLKFLGSTPEELVPAISAELEKLAAQFEAFGFSCEQVGAFPNEKHPRVLWAGVSESGREKLTPLAVAAEQAMIPLGFQPEQRPFSPHLTLGRVKLVRNATAALDPFRTAEFGETQAHELVLYESRPIGGRSTYIPLSRHRLKARR